MSKTPAKIRVEGHGSVAPQGRWACRICGRDFKLPKIPDSCETVWSVCWTCFVVSYTIATVEKKK